jgi:hypothetical protein
MSHVEGSGTAATVEQWSQPLASSFRRGPFASLPNNQRTEAPAARFSPLLGLLARRPLCRVNIFLEEIG